MNEKQLIVYELKKVLADLKEAKEWLSGGIVSTSEIKTAETRIEIIIELLNTHQGGLLNG